MHGINKNRRYRTGYRNYKILFLIQEQYHLACRDNGLTQSQGLAFLLEDKTQNGGKLVQMDLLERLQKADEIIGEKERMIQALRLDVQKERESKDYPKKYRAAELQHQLPQEFFDRLPIPHESSEERIKRLSFKESMWLSALVSKAQDIVNESNLLDKLEYIIAS